MKKLNKVLCLVLALVMVLGCLGVTASATTLKDEQSIDDAYIEAVDVLNALGIIEGYEDGNYYPTKPVTRAQAAKFAAYATMGTKAGNLADDMDDTVYTDMAGSSWANGYINYCTSEDIVCGYNGRFRPTDTVTGYELCKMLLVAAGYGAKDEFIGTGWKSQVLKLAQNKGLAIDGVDLADVVTREEAAQYVFNAITNVVTVSYVAALGDYVENADIEVSVSGSDNICYEDATLGIEYYGLFAAYGEAVPASYSDTCELFTGWWDEMAGPGWWDISTPVFQAGRHGYVWLSIQHPNYVVAAGAEQLTDIYYTDALVSETYEGTTYSGVEYDLWVNGDDDNWDDFTTNTTTEDGQYSAVYTGSFRDQNDRHSPVYTTRTLIVLDPYVDVVETEGVKTATVTATQAAHHDDIEVGDNLVYIDGVTDIMDEALDCGVCKPYVEDYTISYTDGLVSGDVVTVLPMANGKYYVEEAPYVDGTMTARNFKSGLIDSVVIDGETYSESYLKMDGHYDRYAIAKVDWAVDYDYDTNPVFDETNPTILPDEYVRVYVDRGGYVIYTDDTYVAPVAAKTVGVVDSGSAELSGTYFYADADVVLYTGNGETTKFETDLYYAQDEFIKENLGKYDYAGDLSDHLVYLEQNTDGTWNLTDEGVYTFAHSVTNIPEATPGSSVVEITRGVPYYYYDENGIIESTFVKPTEAVGNVLSLDNSTQFIIRNVWDGTYTVVTGYNNLPLSKMYVLGSQIEYIQGDDGIADYVYISRYSNGETTTDSFFVLNVDTTTQTYVVFDSGHKVQVNEMTVMRNGEIYTVYVEDIARFIRGGYYEDVTMHQGVILANDGWRDFMLGEEVTNVADGYIEVDRLTTVGSIFNYKYDDTTVVWLYDGVHNIVKEGTIADITKGDLVVVDGVNGQVANTIYVYFNAAIVGN